MISLKRALNYFGMKKKIKLLSIVYLFIILYLFISDYYICFTTNNVWLKRAEEIIGHFKNGKIQEKARITYYDKSYSLGIYRNARAHGHHRLFNPKGYLAESGMYKKRWPKGYHWCLEYFCCEL